MTKMAHISRRMNGEKLLTVLDYGTVEFATTVIYQENKKRNRYYLKIKETGEIQRFSSLRNALTEIRHNHGTETGKKTYPKKNN